MGVIEQPIAADPHQDAIHQRRFVGPLNRIVRRLSLMREGECMWVRIMATLLLCCLCAAFASAQTAGELRQKYGEPTEGKFLVWPLYIRISILLKAVAGVRD